MKVSHLGTTDSKVQLVEPDINRDAPSSLNWLEGEMGRRTLSLMGVAEKDNHASTLDEERERIKDFIESDDQLNWMIQLDDKIVGSIWIDLKPTKELPAPAIHIMIGDPGARGRGVGSASTAAVINYLRQQGEEAIYSRRLVKNIAASKLLEENGFRILGEAYVDSNGLEWQNTTLDLSK